MENVSTTVQVNGLDLPFKAKHWTIREEETGISHRKLLGRGGFGEVHELSNTETGKAFARKVIRELGFVTKDDVDNEVRALKKLCQNQHPNIVQVFEYGQLNPESTIHFIDMELCEISLGDYLLGQEPKNVVNWATVGPTHAYKILQQILNGLVYIHCLDEVHRDLSPQNVLYRDCVWKIADFGLTSTGTSSRLVTTSAGRGKECYRAPELLRLPQSSGHYNNKSDMWSFGCIAFELFTGRKAFQSDFETYDYGVNNRSPKMYFKGLDDFTKHYMSGLLEVDPEKRPSARTLLKEKFLTEIPSPDSSEAARAQKRKRSTTSGTAPTFDSATSTLLKLTLDWAASNRSLSLILVLVEAGLKPVNPVQAYRILKAFHVNWNDSSCSHLRKLINLYPPSFWQTMIPGFVTKLPDAHNIIEVDDFLGVPSKSESPDMHFVSGTSWSMSPISRYAGEDWDVICTNRFSDISNLHTYHWVSAPREFRDEVQLSVDGSGSYVAVWISGWAKLYNVNFGSDGKTLSLDALSGLPTLSHISCVRFTHNSAHLVVAYMGTRGVCVWDLATQERILQLEPTTYQLSAIDISRDDTVLVGIGTNGYTIWNLETGKTIDSTSGDGFSYKTFNGIALSADGEFVLSKTFYSGYVRVLDEHWDIHLLGHRDFLTSIACSPTNPRQALTGSSDKTVRLWTIPSKEVLKAKFEQKHTSYSLTQARSMAFNGHAESVSTVAFSPDARWIASGCRDGSVRLWDPKNGTLELLLYKHVGNQVTSVAFLPSSLGSLLAVAYNDGTLGIWNYTCNEGDS